MSRFLVIDSAPIHLTPVYGYLAAPLLPLESALESISSQVSQLDRFSKIAKNSCHYPSEHGLTKEESAAVFLYTMEWGDNSFYHVLNRALRVEDRSTLKPWFPYLKLFDTAVQKLPTIRKNVWRGITRDISKNYKKGAVFTWWAISSCSTSVDIIENFLSPNSTLFLIEAINGKDLSKYTNFPTEDEVILCPGTRLQVVSDPLDKPPMHLVHLREITDDSESQLVMSVESVSIGPTFETTSNSQLPSLHIYTDQDGNRYEGEMKEAKKHGKGKMEYANGDNYDGMWVNDVKMGQGVQIYANGDRFKGQWKDDKKDGQGVCSYANGDRYEGQWKDDKMNGQGVYSYVSGSRYEGQWKDDKMNGPGVYTNSKGDRYEGQWKDGNMDGQGVYSYVSGSRYEGQWKDDKKDGQGVYTYVSGSRYEGQWKDDKKDGQGVCSYANGDRYEGQWKDDKKDGQGVYTYANGARFKGQWKDDKRAD